MANTSDSNNETARESDENSQIPETYQRKFNELLSEIGNRTEGLDDSYDAETKWSYSRDLRSKS